MSSAASPPSAGSTRWLSREFAELFADATRCHAHAHATEAAFDVLIVGSGYGGAIAAAELAGSGRVGVLERGREYLPGGFPSRLAELPTHLRGRFAGKARGGEALFDVRADGDAGVVLANGLGGGSLINAGVMLEAPAEVFDQRWPAALRTGRTLRAFYAEARTLLGAQLGERANTIPAPLPAKARVLGRLDAAAQPVPVTIAFEDRPSSAGVALSACKRCGDCATGCNHGAKESLDTNLLVSAVRRGAEIWCGATVLRVQRAAGGAGWAVEVTHTDEALRRCETGPRWIVAHRVILAAGSLGSTEILLRSQQATPGLRFSPRLGAGFSGNGDLIAFGYDYGETGRANAVAHEDQAPETRGIGPTITSAFSAEVRDRVGRRRRLLVEEMAVPAALRRPAEEIITTVQTLHRLAARDAEVHSGGHPADDPLALRRERIRDLSVFAVMGDDDAGGRLRLRADDSGAGDGAIDIVWPELRRHPLFDAQMQLLQRRAHGAAHAGFDGVTLPNPLWRPLPEAMERALGVPRGAVVTVHPLGGCGMADAADRGVVDDCGRVFLRDGDAWRAQDDLVVLDGAIVPCALGVNPALTIAALALRAVRILRTQWSLAAAPPAAAATIARPRLDPPPTPADTQGSGTQVGISERLSGTLPLRIAGQGVVDCHVELTLCYRMLPIEHLFVPDAEGRLSSARLDLISEGPNASRLRVVPAATRARLIAEGLDADARAREEERLGCSHALTGSLVVFERVPTRAWPRTLRALWAWWRNRGLRDAVQSLCARWRGVGRSAGSLRTQMRDMIALASHAGEVRCFRYEMQIGPRLSGGDAGFVLPLDEAARSLRGHKHIGYGRPSNPWRQLQEMQLTEFGGVLAGKGPQALVLDPAYFAERSQPLLRIEAQRCHVEALADLAALAALVLRLLLSTHQLSARKPDAPRPRQAQRLPGRLPGLPEPQIHEIEVGRLDDRPLRIRLCRYRREERDGANAPPVLLIHGYSASGNTYAHPALRPSLAQDLAEHGRDVWIVDLRSSAGLATAQRPWTFEQVALSDIPAAVEHVVDCTGAAQIDVVAHCMGAVMFSMAVLSAELPADTIAALLRDRGGGCDAIDRFRGARAALPGRIRRAVLSQNGPAMVLTPQNVFRGYVLSYFEALLGPLAYRFDAAPEGLLGELFDRLLATLPYPDDELLRENSACLAQSVRFAGVRHRMDALYGRTFSLRNVDDAVLDHIDELFGPLNLDTVAQVIHFARHQVITDRGGHNRFVTPAALRAHWRFPTLLLHGSDNGLADPATLHRNARLLRDAGVAVEAVMLDGMGHQDCLIGRRAAETFERIRGFLDAPPPKAAAAAPQYLARVPWLGPVLYATDDAAQWIGLGASPRLGRPHEIVLLPLRRDASGVWRKADQAAETVAAPADCDWCRLRLPAWSGIDGVLVLLVYEQSAAIGASDRDAPPAGVGASVEAATAQALDAFLKASPARALGLVELPAPADPARLRIALGSCQYPPGIFNTAPAQASWRRLNARLDGGERPDLLLLTGDQVYVDATAGLFDPADLHDRFRKPYETWLHDAEVRDVLRRVPLATLPDDHEIVDNWQPIAGQRGDAAFDANQQLRELGVAQFLRFQRAPGADPDRLSMTLRVGDVPLYLLDTRTRRSHRSAARTEVPMFSDPCEWTALREWLRCAPSERPKLIVSPAPLLPRHRSAVRARLAFERCDVGTHAALNADGWDGYPQTFHALLALLASEPQVGPVVFLCGDAHLGLFVEAEVEVQGRRTRFHVVHTAGLNTPYRFANAAPSDFLLDEDFAFVADGHQGRCRVRTQVSSGAGFTHLTLYRAAEGWRLDYRFDSEDGLGLTGSVPL
ncbi:alpha/beta fold hydrolase [Sinimarinibacterium thermocellulolyticum]|uniref:Cholesterol oxidase n=1 Tax=Sinimarinibacterium thermocellulolyticum TaxID=3170016 RepID=A0ABV2A651_9GAMM